jgi:hypothetical protein
MLMETCLYLVMAEIQVIQFHENGGHLQVIILMDRWSLTLVIVFFKELLSMKWYGIGLGCRGSKLSFKRTDLKTGLDYGANDGHIAIEWALQEKFCQTKEQIEACCIIGGGGGGVSDKPE